MSSIKKELVEEQPLRLTHPTCYQHLLDQFSLTHLHPYDVKASVIAQEDGYLMVLRFGDDLKQEKQKFFDNAALVQLSEELTDFYEEVAQLCKKTLIADYFKMMKS